VEPIAGFGDAPLDSMTDPDAEKQIRRRYSHFTRFTSTKVQVLTRAPLDSMADRDAQKQTHDRNKGVDITEKKKHRKKDEPPDSMTDLDDAGCSVCLLC
jgi:hypothetical protein